MSNPTTRILAVLELLQAHGLLSGAELSARLNIDGRTLRRYIATLETLGIPVVADRGRDGGYRLMHGFKLPPMMFNNEEALALALGLVAARHLGLEEAAPASASALAKLERVMPENLKQQFRAIGGVVKLGLAKANASGKPKILATLSVATEKQQRVRLQYRAPQQSQTEREVDPYGLAFWEGSWYVVGYCHLRLGLRSFRLDRIVAATARPAYFARPENFDAMVHMKEAIASLPRAHTIKVLLRTDLATARAMTFTSLGLLESVNEGVILHSQADDLPWMARELARMPFRFDIVEPLALRDELIKHARALLSTAESN